MELECLIDCTGTAAWRRMKAEEYPEDGRNLEAAASLDRLAKDIARLEGSNLHREVEDTWDRQADRLSFVEAVSEHLRSVGFSYAPRDGEALVADIVGCFSK